MSENDPKKWTVSELRCFLSNRGKVTTGNKRQLLEAVEEVLKAPVIICQNTAHNINKEIFKDENLDWKNILEHKICLPESFDIEEVTKFLLDTKVVIRSPLIEGDSGDDDEEEEEVQIGTGKPVAKGRRMYASEKVHFVEFVVQSGDIYIRANVESSMKRMKSRFVKLALTRYGKIDFAECTCMHGEVDGHCAHVATILYLLEDVSIGNNPKLHNSCTSTPQVWGQGSVRDNNPEPVYTHKYGKKRKADKFIYKDPRPPRLQCTTQEEKHEFLRNLQSLPHDTMFGKLLEFKYEDYELSPERKNVLKNLSTMVEDVLNDDVRRYGSDPLSNECAVHVSGSESQAESDIWQTARKFRITASTLKHFITKDCTAAKNLWETKCDISEIAAIKWGREKEAVARQAYIQKTGEKVHLCGLFVSKEFPMLAASPDGLTFENGIMGVIEIKCPYSLRFENLTELGKVDPMKKKNFFCNVSDGFLNLKKSHDYFLQCQTQMYVTGATFCNFVI